MLLLHTEPGAEVTPQDGSSRPQRGESGSRHARSHYSAVLGGRSYYPLFVLLLVSLIFLVGASDYAWGVRLGQTVSAGALLLAVRASRAGRGWIVAGWIGLGFAVAASLLTALLQGLEISPSSPTLGGLGLISIVLLVVSVPLILRRIASDSRVTGETVVAAVCAYLLIGMDFALLYQLFSSISGQAVIASNSAAETTVGAGDYYYFSFINMATVGFGDLIPITNPAKTVALLQGVLGQLFLVTIVARLVSVATFRKRSEPSPDEAESGAGLEED